MLKDRAGKENEGQVQLGKCRGCFCTLPRVTLLKETDFFFLQNHQEMLHFTLYYYYCILQEEPAPTRNQDTLLNMEASQSCCQYLRDDRLWISGEYSPSDAYMTGVREIWQKCYCVSITQTGSRAYKETGCNITEVKNILF